MKDGEEVRKKRRDKTGQSESRWKEKEKIEKGEEDERRAGDKRGRYKGTKEGM